MESISFTPKSEINCRIKKLQKRLLENSIKGAVIIQKADLFYFSGTAQDAHLFVPDQGSPILMVKRNFQRAVQESAIDNVIQIKSITDILQPCPAGKKIGMELDVLPANLFFKYKAIFSDLEIVDISRIIRQIRTIKSDYEIVANSSL